MNTILPLTHKTLANEKVTTRESHWRNNQALRLVVPCPKVGGQYK